MEGSYTYRNRPLNQQAMRQLIPKLYAGQTKTREDIIEGVEREHRRRGGAPTGGSLEPWSAGRDVQGRGGVVEASGSHRGRGL